MIQIQVISDSSLSSIDNDTIRNISVSSNTKGAKQLNLG